MNDFSFAIVPQNRSEIIFFYIGTSYSTVLTFQLFKFLSSANHDKCEVEVFRPPTIFNLNRKILIFLSADASYCYFKRGGGAISAI